MASISRRFSTAAVAAAAISTALLIPSQASATARHTESTTSSAPTLATPTPTAPADNDTTPLKDVVLAWDSVAGAASYTVEISPNDQFTNNQVTLPDGGVTDNTTYDVPISLPHASYYWRVQAVAGSSVSDWSTPRQFLHEWDANTDPSGSFSMLTTPSDSPLFSWTPVQDASLYNVRLSTRPDFTGADTYDCWTAATSLYPYDSVDRDNSTTGCFSQANLTDGTKYYWEVRPYDDTTAPSVTGDTVNDPDWECDTNVPECDAVAQFGSFTFTPVAAGTPDQNTPVQNLQTSYISGSDQLACSTGNDPCPTTPTLSWSPVAGANYYRVRIYLDPDETNTYRTYETPYPALTPRDLLPDNQTGTSYFWSVEAGTCVNSIDDNNCAAPEPGQSQAEACASGSGTSGPVISSVSAPQNPVPGGSKVTVTIDGSNFDAGACVTPSAGEVVSTNYVSPTEVQATWDTPYGDASQDVTFTVTNSDGSTSAASTDSITVESADKTVFYGGTSDGSEFSVNTGAVTPSSPADGATVSNRNLVYSWSDYLNSGGQGSTEARNYEVQVATDDNFNNVVQDYKDIDFTHYVDPLAALKSGTYFWRVGVIDETGNLLHWSSVRSMTVEATGPKISITSKSGIGVKSPVAIRSSAALTGVTTGSDSPSIYLVDAKGNPVSGTLTKTGATTYTFTPSQPLVTGGSYAVGVAAGVTDAVGNQAVASSASVTTTTKADNTSAGWTFSKGWKTQKNSSAIGGSFASAGKGKVATIQVDGSSATLSACKAPSYGSIAISAGGKVKTVSLHQGFTQCGLTVWTGSLKPGVQTIKVRVVKGTGDIDELTVAAAKSS